MSSERWLVLALVLPLGCAGFSRGDYWPDTDGDDGTVDGGDDDSVDDDMADGGDDNDDDATSDDDVGDDDDDDDDDDETGETTGGSNGPSFALDVLPLLRAGCERCHAEDGEASDTDYVLGASDEGAYDMTLDFIDLDAPSSSRLLAKTAGKGHTGGAIYSDHSAQYETMLDWIEHGALP